MNYTNPNQNINIYFKEIRSNESLTRKDEIELFTRIARGDKSAENEVFNKVSKLAVAIAKTYTDNPDLLEDLIQEANIGVLTAIQKYDFSTGFRFSTYARWWMKAAITKFLGEKELVYSSNPRITQMIHKIRDIFYKENSRDITEYELLEKLEDMGEVVTDISCLTGIKMTRIDQQLNEDQDITTGDFGEFAEVTSSENEYIRKEEEEYLEMKVNSLLNRLTPRERILVKMRFGLEKDYEMNFDDITKEWNKSHFGKESLTQERVRQIVNEAIKKMK